MIPRQLAHFAMIFGLLTAVSDAGERNSFTWSPKPYEKTKTYMVQNFRAGYSLLTSDLKPYLDAAGFMFSYETGLMVNVDRRIGLGVGGWAAFEDQRSRMGVGPRARFWLSGVSALDVSAGPIVVQFDDPTWPVDIQTLFATATYSFHENLLITFHFESVKYGSTAGIFGVPLGFPSDERKNYLYSGIGTGGNYALIGAGTATALLMAFALVVGGGTFVG